MNKADFIKYVHENRKANFRQNSEYYFPEVEVIDDELLWRIYQLFPSEWDEDDRYAATTVMVCHLTFFGVSMLEREIPLSEAVNQMFIHLVELGYRIGKKYLRRFLEVLEYLSENNQ